MTKPELKLALDMRTSENTPPERLDKALLRKVHEVYPTLSRTALKSCFQSGSVQLNGRTATASQLLGAGENLVLISPWCIETMMILAAVPAPEGCFLPVVYEDENLFVLHKPSGCPSIPHSQTETNTAVNAALAYFPGIAEVGFAGLEPGILHRLDTETSGLLVFAKTDLEFKRLRTAWKTPAVRKIYRVLTVAASAPQVPRLLDFPLAHDGHSKKRMIALLPKPAGRNASIRGKPLPSRTRLQAIHGFQPDALDLEVEIETGVMHQIRCTLAAIGLPVQGDRVYRGKESSRLWLHAWKLILPLQNGTELHLNAKLPQGWP